MKLIVEIQFLYIFFSVDPNRKIISVCLNKMRMATNGALEAMEAYLQENPLRYRAFKTDFLESINYM